MPRFELLINGLGFFVCFTDEPVECPTLRFQHELRERVSDLGYIHVGRDFSGASAVDFNPTEEP